MSKCGAITKNGTACRGIPLPGEPYCYAHHPDNAEKIRAYGAKGGRRGGKGRQSPVTAELTRLQELFEELASRIERGEIDRGVGAVMIQAYNGARACVSAILKAKEIEEIEVRLAELERRQTDKREGRRYG